MRYIIEGNKTIGGKEKMDKEEAKKLYYTVHGQPREMFIKSFLHFRSVMCSTKYSIEQKEQALEGFATDYFRCNLNVGDPEIFEATVMEGEMRKLYEINLPINRNYKEEKFGDLPNLNLRERGLNKLKQ